MTMNKLKRFGMLQKTFKGKGVLRFQDGTEVTAKFTLAQLTNVDLVFTALIDLPQWEYLNREANIDSVFGKLSDGRSANINGLFIKYVEANPSLTKTNLTGYASNFTFGTSEFNADALISFEITNFLFLGDKFEKKTTGDTTISRRSLLNLDLDSRKIILRQDDKYEQIEVELKAQKKVKITCTATTAIKNSLELDEVTQTIDMLCDVMSVARSTLVSWTSYEVMDESTGMIFSNYRNSVTRNYSGTSLIHNNDAKNTKLFLENAYSQHKVLSGQYKVRQLARAYTETRSGGFIESRSMLIGVLAEYVASIQARLDNRSDFLPTDTFESGWKEFSSEVKTLLLKTYPGVKPNYVSTMINVVKGLNRRPFSWKLNNLARKFAIKVAQGEIEKIVTTRNNLAHQGRFSEDEAPVAQYLRMQHFIDRLILRLFVYHGPYYDMEHNKMDEI